MNKNECKDAMGKAWAEWWWSRPGLAYEKPKAERVKLILEYRKYRAMMKTAPPEMNNRGNILLRDEDACKHLGAIKKPQDRYVFDFELCQSSDGWIQFDTSQDASYFGVWCNPKKLETVTYAEGDVTLVQCQGAAGYNRELTDMSEFYGSPPPAFIGIDNDGQVTHYIDERPQLLPE